MHYIPVLADEIIEQRILELLASGTVLTLNEISIALVGLATTEHIRAVLADLRRNSMVTTQAQRRGVWYLGYRIGEGSTNRQPEPDEIPQPFRALLSQLSW